MTLIFASSALRERERGQGLAEYALILLLVGIVSIAVLLTFGDVIQAQYQCIHYAVVSAGSPAQVIVGGSNSGISCNGTVAQGDITVAVDSFPGDPEYVKMTILKPDGTTSSQDEYLSPYTLFGDNNATDPANYNKQNLSSGNYRVTMTGYTDGNPGTSMTYVFNVE